MTFSYSSKSNGSGHNQLGKARASKPSARKSLLQSNVAKRSSSTNKTRRVTTADNGATAMAGGIFRSGMGGDQLEKQLRATLHKTTRDRDTQHRQCVVANQRLGAAKAAVKNLQKNVEEERRKHTATTKELNRTKIEVDTMEGSIENMKLKYDFQHKDLIQKRHKIAKQKDDMEISEAERQKILNDSKALLAEQYKKIKNLSETQRLEFFNRLNRAIDDSQSHSKLVDAELEDVFEIDGDVRADDDKAGKKKSRHNQIDEDLKFDLMLMASDDWIIKLIDEKTESLEEEKRMIDHENFRLKSVIKSHGIDLNVEENGREDKNNTNGGDGNDENNVSTDPTTEQEHFATNHEGDAQQEMPSEDPRPSSTGTPVAASKIDGGQDCSLMHEEKHPNDCGGQKEVGDSK